MDLSLTFDPPALGSGTKDTESSSLILLSFGSVTDASVIEVSSRYQYFRGKIPATSGGGVGTLETNDGSYQ